jgi:hypothetical protein
MMQAAQGLRPFRRGLEPNSASHENVSFRLRLRKADASAFVDKTLDP